MSYDLVAVGGTGQWFLLQLALYATEQQDLPRRLWVVDRDFDLRDPNSLASTMAVAFNRAAGWTDPQPRPVDFNERLCRPVLPRNGAQNIATWFGSALTGDITYPALTERERSTPVERGFHALPRLAAVWVSIHGFEGQSVENVGGIRLPDCFNDAQLFDPNGPPLVIVGSLAGGTGAGLLPYLFRQARRGDPQSWRRPVVVIAVLPWFNPEGASPDQAVTWQDTCRNASYGVRTLFRVMRTLSETAGATPNIGWTRCVFAGPDSESAFNQPPEQSELCRDRALVAPVLRSLVQSLPALVSPPQAVAQRPPFVTGTIQVLSARYNSEEGQREIAIEQVANLYAGLRAEELSKFPLKSAASILGGVQRVEGLGVTLRDLVLTVSMAPAPNRSRFFEVLANQLMTRRQTLTGGLPLTFSGTAATEPAWIISDLDKETSDAERRQLMVLADCATLDTLSVERRACSVADQLADILQRHSCRFFVSEPECAVERLRHLGVATRRLLASYSDRVIQANEYPALCPFIPTAEQDEEDQLAAVYSRAGGLAAAFHSRSYATYLSAAHVLEECVRTLLPGHEAEGIPKLNDVLLLWRAAINGFLTRQPVVGDRLSEIERTESVPRDFPALTAFRLDGHVVAFSSADMGFVPHVDWLEDGAHENSEIARIKASLAQRLSEESSSDKEVLYSFAYDVLQRAQIASANSPPWAKLLMAINHMPANPGQVLQKKTVRGFRLGLCLAAGVPPVTRSVPLKADADKLERVLNAAQQFTTFLPDRVDPGGVHTLMFDPFGNDPKDVCSFEIDGQDKLFTTVDHALLERAACAV